MRTFFLLALLPILTNCSEDIATRLQNVNRTTFDSYCASYDQFPTAAGGDAVRYTIDRIKFIAGIDKGGAEGCAGAFEKFRDSTRIPFDPARGAEMYVVHLGGRSISGNLEFAADPGDSFALENLEAFTYFPFITHLYLPHGKIRDLSPLASITALQVLDVRNNQVQELGDALNAPTHLEYVDLSFNHIDSTAKISGDYSLTYLDVSNNPELKDTGNLQYKKALVHYYGPKQPL